MLTSCDFHHRGSAANVEHGRTEAATRYDGCCDFLGGCRDVLRSAAVGCNASSQIIIRKSRPYLGPGSVNQEDAAMNIVPGEWRQGGWLQEMTPAACRNASNAAKGVRLIFADYFVSPQGAVPWQNKVL